MKALAPRFTPPETWSHPNMVWCRRKQNNCKYKCNNLRCTLGGHNSAVVLAKCSAACSWVYLLHCSSFHETRARNVLISTHIKSFYGNTACCAGLLQEEMHLWQKRPCPVPLLRLMAQSVTHLIPLRLALIHTFMMDYMTLVDSYLESSYFEPDELSYLNMVSTATRPHLWSGIPD